MGDRRPHSQRQISAHSCIAGQHLSIGNDDSGVVSISSASEQGTGMKEPPWRPATTADSDVLAALFREVTRVAPVGLEMSPPDVRARLTRPGLDLHVDTRAAVDPAGRLVGYAETADMGVGQGIARIRLTSAIHPCAGEDLAAALHEWSIQRAEQISRDRHPDLPTVLGTRCAAADAPRLGRLTGSGFEILHWEHDLIRPTAPLHRRSPHLTASPCCRTSSATTRPPASRTTRRTPTARVPCCPTPRAGRSTRSD